MMAGLYGATRLGDMGAEAMRRLADADVIAAPVLAYPKTVCDPQVAHNRMEETRLFGVRCGAAPGRGGRAGVGRLNEEPVLVER